MATPSVGPASGTAFRTLGLTTPYMHGSDVHAAQDLLAHNRYGNFHPGAADGEYGPMTAAATERAKVALGFAGQECDHSFSATVEGYLQGTPLPPDFEARRKAYERAKAAAAGIRTQIVANARWGVAHEPEIHYAKTRPIDGHGHARKLPLTTDCSGFVTDCYEWAGTGPQRQRLQWPGLHGHDARALPAHPGVRRPGGRPRDLGSAPGRARRARARARPRPLACLARAGGRADRDQLLGRERRASPTRHVALLSELTPHDGSPTLPDARGGARVCPGSGGFQRPWRVGLGGGSS